LKKSLKKFDSHFVGLVVSTPFFMSARLKKQPELLLSRTSPNIYDILIAFLWFGCNSHYKGRKGNPIPGVAIATALMPPLCTSRIRLSIREF
jgi:uncharacterized membrane protein